MENKKELVFKFTEDEWGYKVDDIRDELKYYVLSDSQIILDLSGIKKFCSLAVSRLLSVINHYKENNKEIKLINVSNELKHLFERLKISSFLNTN